MEKTWLMKKSPFQRNSLLAMILLLFTLIGCKEYSPTWVEICVTLGILALGMLVVTLLIRPALLIEERFELESSEM